MNGNAVVMYFVEEDGEGFYKVTDSTGAEHASGLTESEAMSLQIELENAN